MCKKPHKHADLIKAWADGTNIQYLNHVGQWVDCKLDPRWGAETVYRIKPEPLPDIVGLATLTPLTPNLSWTVKVTLDGENPRILKSVEILK